MTVRLLTFVAVMFILLFFFVNFKKYFNDLDKSFVSLLITLTTAKWVII